MSELHEDMVLALALADAADAITTARFRALDLRIEAKPDLSPVTDADRDTESRLRELLAAARPHDAIHGEEFADTGASGSSARRWVIDPIDGTKNYVRGVPVWASLIALMDGPNVIVGVVSAPALGRRWWASAGGGAWARTGSDDPVACRVSAVPTLTDASLSYSSLSGWEERGLLPGFLDLTRRCWRTRAFGDFWSYVLLAEGTVDVAAEPEVALHDLAPLALIVAEAGGVFTDLTGRPGPDGGSALASNGLLHSAALALLQPDSSTGAA
ncbi:inositol monophosphatase family protein [Sporichthya sp.]|uniref:inositol monophosphatase family protein n=1 Tax=Sporichthya sp. TaxID=65475 RepID=UPI0017A53DF2|nr:inositol monophosphatase family protein [Sporichthya sp.]MBA3745258.1 histidinol phosphatase [Sporichthya sp.]